MTYYPDLSPYTYNLEDIYLNPNTVNVGWLSAGEVIIRQKYWQDQAELLRFIRATKNWPFQKRINTNPQEYPLSPPPPSVASCKDTRANSSAPNATRAAA